MPEPAMPEPEITRERAIAFFSGLSLVNQFAAGAEPEKWAAEQARTKPDQHDLLLAAARHWQTYMIELAEEEE